ncbi:MAG: hypothetical protein CR986_04720 [Ignavibacteriae bacterium]|nr:MAG: hypothetical protein CR986_04720 [Ignavibacteriota bacterium]
MKKKLVLLQFLLAVLLLILSSCSNKTELEELSKVYVDNLIVETTYCTSDSLLLKKKEVFNKYNMTEEAYKEKIKSINQDYSSWKTFFDLANAYLDTLKAKNKRAEVLHYESEPRVGHKRQ